MDSVYRREFAVLLAAFPTAAFLSILPHFEDGVTDFDFGPEDFTIEGWFEFDPPIPWWRSGLEATA